MIDITMSIGDVAKNETIVTIDVEYDRWKFLDLRSVSDEEG
jgi:hypothetical protein